MGGPDSGAHRSFDRSARALRIAWWTTEMRLFCETSTCCLKLWSRTGSPCARSDANVKQVRVERLEFDSLPPDFLTDPYRYYSILRAEDPVHLSSRGVW